MDAKPFHFLVVEDNEDHAQLVLRHLKRSKILCSTCHVKDGLAALDYLRRQGDFAQSPPPDVIILDLNLPKVSGMELLQTLKEDKNLRSIPVVVLTTSDAESDRSMAYLRYANSYLVKPVDFEMFRTLIRDLSTYWGKWNRRAMI